MKLTIIAAIIAVALTWQVQDWRCEAKLKKLEAEQAQQNADRAGLALDTLEKRINVINESAQSYLVSEKNLSVQINQLRNEIKNAKPLPVDCRPDAERLRQLEAAVRSANNAASGRDTSQAVQ